MPWIYCSLVALRSRFYCSRTAVLLLHECWRDAICVKTGTAEVNYGNANNAWIAGWLPARAPRFAFCCVFWQVPKGVHGGAASGRAVARVFERIEADPVLAARYPLRGGD